MIRVDTRRVVTTVQNAKSGGNLASIYFPRKPVSAAARFVPVVAMVAETPKQPVLIELKPDPAIKRRRMEEELVELGLI